LVIVSGPARYVLSHPSVAPSSALSQDLRIAATSHLRTRNRVFGLLLSSFTSDNEFAIRLGLHTGTHRYRRVSGPFLVGQLIIFFFSRFSGRSCFRICFNSDQDSCSLLIFVVAFTRHASSSTGTNQDGFFWQEFLNLTSATGSSLASLLDLSQFFFL